jgi:hypothetical protein
MRYIDVLLYIIPCSVYIIVIPKGFKYTGTQPSQHTPATHMVLTLLFLSELMGHIWTGDWGVSRPVISLTSAKPSNLPSLPYILYFLSKGVKEG